MTQEQTAVVAAPKVPSQIGLKLGPERMAKLRRLTRDANFQKPTHLIAALIDHLDSIAEPFDVRDLELKK